jgi:cytochrome c553
MKQSCLLLVIAWFAVISAVSPFSLWSKDVADGAELFKARCGTCHGEKGEGLDSADVPPINRTPMTVERLAELITKGKSGTRVHYSPIVNVDDTEARAIAEYMKNLK